MDLCKAKDLDGILDAFEPEPLRGAALDIFYCDSTINSRVADEYKSPLDDLFQDCSRSPRSKAYLFMGHMGCGKSTELNVLARRLRQAGHPTIIIDCRTETDLFKFDQWDIMLLFTEGLCKIVEESECRLGIKDGILEDILDYLKTDITVEEVHEKQASLGVESGLGVKTPALLSSVLSLMASIKGRLKIGQYTREKLSTNMQRRAAEWLEYVRVIANQITHQLDGKKPVIIFENLDKIQPADRIFKIFSHTVLAETSFPVIYTFPISQFYAPEFAILQGAYSYLTLPMIKIRNIDGSRFEPGIRAIFSIVNLRKEEGCILWNEDAMEELILKTGGVLRDLFKCIIAAARRAQRRGLPKFEMEDVKVALTHFQSDLIRWIDAPDYKPLAKIYQDQGQRRNVKKDFLLKMTMAGALIEYNGEHWHDVHPLVADFLIKQGYADERRP